MKIALSLAALATFSAAPAAAQLINDPAPGYSSILGANYVAAEREIRTADVSPYDPARAINLGVVFAKTGRSAAAEEMFQRAMLLDDEPMVVANGQTVSAHEVAGRALALLRAGYFNR